MSEATEFYGTGEHLPVLHPDETINLELQVQALCAQLDTARVAIGGALEMNVITPALLKVKDNLRWALEATAPKNFNAPHNNHG